MNQFHVFGRISPSSRQISLVAAEQHAVLVALHGADGPADRRRPRSRHRPRSWLPRMTGREHALERAEPGVAPATSG